MAIETSACQPSFDSCSLSLFLCKSQSSCSHITCRSAPPRRAGKKVTRSTIKFFLSPRRCEVVQETTFVGLRHCLEVDARVRCRARGHCRHSLGRCSGHPRYSTRSARVRGAMAGICCRKCMWHVSEQEKKSCSLPTNMSGIVCVCMHFVLCFFGVMLLFQSM